MDPFKLRVAALVVTAAVVVCMAVSVGVPQWCTVREFESQTKQYFTGYYGLFKDCSTLEHITRCQTYADEALTGMSSKHIDKHVFTTVHYSKLC